MIVMLGIITMGALVGVLAFCMSSESKAEKRRSTLGRMITEGLPSGDRAR